MIHYFRFMDSSHKDLMGKRSVRVKKWLSWGIIVFLFCQLVLLGGCVAQRQSCPASPDQARENAHTYEAQTNLVEVCYHMVDEMIKNLRQPLNPQQTILVASLVDVQNMEQSSDFGRIAAEYLTSRFGQRGFAVREMKLRNTVYMQEQGGEFLLSRSLKNISAQHRAQAVVVGTYAWAFDHVYVSVRLVLAENSSIISSSDIKLPLNLSLRTLLHSQGWCGDD